MQTKPLLFLTLIILLTACTPLTSQPTETPEQVSVAAPSLTPTNTPLNTPSPDQPMLLSTNPSGVLATPVSDSPASGICAEAEDEIVVITFNIDVPDPRCIIVHQDQKLKIINYQEGTVEAMLGQFEAVLPPGSEILFDMSFGEYLEPGVHFVGCCGGELWLKDD